VHLGRSRTNAVFLADGKVSRNHARLDPVRTTYIITDLGSANGTFVKGVRITQPVRLQDGDWFQVGDTQLVFHTRPAIHAQQVDHVVNYPLPSPVLVADSRPAPANLPLSFGGRGRLPVWMWIGCAVLIIIILLTIVALTTGILIGQGLGVG
jgi:hypothetical protein